MHLKRKGKRESWDHDGRKLISGNPQTYPRRKNQKNKKAPGEKYSKRGKVAAALVLEGNDKAATKSFAASSLAPSLGRKIRPRGRPDTLRSPNGPPPW